MNTPASFQMASGDTLLLFALDFHDIEHFNSLSETLEDFQIVLLLAEVDPFLQERGYALQPRFVCQGEEDISILHQMLIKNFNTMSSSQGVDKT